MGTFRHTLAIGSPDSSRFEDVTALVDTGSNYTWIPRPVLERLGISPSLRREFEAAP
jgi:predicted aspartyl protease